MKSEDDLTNRIDTLFQRALGPEAESVNESDDEVENTEETWHDIGGRVIWKPRSMDGTVLGLWMDQIGWMDEVERAAGRSLYLTLLRGVTAGTRHSPKRNRSVHQYWVSRLQ